jgi:catechol-2,3-dioxygenase
MADKYPRAVTHVGVTVTHVDRAMEWYQDVLGFEVLAAPRTIDRSDESEREQIVDLLGQSFDSLRLGHLTTGNQVGFEVFEFSGGSEMTERDPREPGFFHVCVVEPDVESLAREIDERGGDHYSEITTSGSEDRVTTYCRDPWGNRIEITSQSYERYQSGRS